MNALHRSRSTRSVPTVYGIDVTDLSAVVGATIWTAVTLSGGLGSIERALALAPLVLVPLCAGMAATPPFDGVAGRFYDAGVLLQPVGAILLVASLVAPSGGLAAALAVPWVLVTGLLGLAGAVRALNRGPRPIAETVIDAGLAYATVGAVALVASHLGVTFRFSPVVVLLTAVHFHYAGFVLPVVTGLVGRCGETSRYRALAGVVLVGPAIVAVGISFSPAVELVGVAAFSVAVALLGGYVAARVAPGRPRAQGVLLATSTLTLPASMLLALGFVVATVTGIDPLGLGLSRMVLVHGSLNAYGFALLATVAWRLSIPRGGRPSDDRPGCRRWRRSNA